MLKRILGFFRQMGDKDVDAQRRAVEDRLKSLSKKLERLSDQVDSMPDEVKAATVEMLSQARQQISDLEAEWRILSLKSEFSKENLQALQAKISGMQQNISILARRQAHLRNLELLQERLTQQQMDLPGDVLHKDVLHKTLEPHIHELQEQISLLKQKKVELTPPEQKRLEVHQRNLELYQQMLAGELAYTPLHLLNQIEAEEQSIREIDMHFASLEPTKNRRRTQGVGQSG